jgi:tetratricopeptide (TPR) repeat protein
LDLTKAEVLVAQRKVEPACEIYEAVLKVSPKNPRALCGKGAIEAHRDNWTQARALFEQAQQIAPTYDVPLAGLGLCAWRDQEGDKAWNYYRQAAKINPENLRALLGIIELGYQRKRYAEIEEALRAYLELHPMDLEFVYSLAGCLYAQERLQDAAKEIDKITLFDPTHKNALELRRMIEERPAQASGAA